MNTLATSRVCELDDNKNEVISYDNGLHQQYAYLYVGSPMLPFSDKWRVNANRALSIETMRMN